MRISTIEAQVDARLEDDSIHLYVNDVTQIETGFAEVEEGDIFDLHTVIDELAADMAAWHDLNGLKRISKILKGIRADVKERIAALTENVSDD